MTFRVEITRRAKKDIDTIIGWIKKKSPQGAKSWAKRLDEVVHFISHSAEQCTLARENDDSPLQIQQIVFRTRSGKPYRALFTIHGGVVFVIHVRAPGQELVPPHELTVPESAKKQS